MQRFAAAGNPVLFIENTGVRAPTLSDLPRLASRVRNWWGGVEGFRERGPNLIVLSPLLLPFPYSPLARWLNARLLERAIRNWMEATRRGSVVLWTFIPTPLVLDLIADLAPSLTVYYCIDNFSASSPAAKAIEISENRLFETADLVFVTSRELSARARRCRPEAHIFPFGVDFESFDSRRGRTGEPSDVASIPHPRLGYIGGIHRWVDLDLLKRAATARPGCHFVLVGPTQTDVTSLAGLPNVHMLGTRSHTELPAYVASFDAGLIPYLLTEYTASVYPTKLNEYFAMGVPVISTALPEVTAYNESNGGVVDVARDHSGFNALIGEVLTRDGAGREARIEAARRNGWSERLKTMSAIMVDSLASKRARPEVMEGLLRRLTRRYRRPTAAVALTCAAAFAVLRWSPMVWGLAEPLRLVEAPTTADAVIVLGDGAGESGAIGQSHEERVDRAIQLYRQGLVGKVVLCSSTKWTFSEIEVMRAIALTKGVKDEDILLEPSGGSTREMIANSAGLARAKAWRKILLVSSPYHMRRAVGAWKKQAPGVGVVATPASRSSFYSYREQKHAAWRKAGPTWNQLKALLQETAALAFYRFRSWL
ncbi:MAG: YdcF family protein [Elusimicrobia bacterium]|nr:YdcF family protein [Elusimicrobiota bacterium]